MFKVSFKKTEEGAVRQVIKEDEFTEVSLYGTMEVPKWWIYIPVEIMDWFCDNYTNYSPESSLTFIHNGAFSYRVCTRGSSKCSEVDRYNPLLGERIAESRAKYRLYKVLYTLCNKLCEYYGHILYGEEGFIADPGSPGSLMSDVKKYEGLMIKESHHLGELLKETTDE